MKIKQHLKAFADAKFANGDKNYELYLTFQNLIGQINAEGAEKLTQALTEPDFVELLKEANQSLNAEAAKSKLSPQKQGLSLDDLSSQEIGLLSGGSLLIVLALRYLFQDIGSFRKAVGRANSFRSATKGVFSFALLGMGIELVVNGSGEDIFYNAGANYALVGLDVVSFIYFFVNATAWYNVKYGKPCCTRDPIEPGGEPAAIRMSSSLRAFNVDFEEFKTRWPEVISGVHYLDLVLGDKYSIETIAEIKRRVTEIYSRGVNVEVYKIAELYKLLDVSEEKNPIKLLDNLTERIRFIYECQDFKALVKALGVSEEGLVLTGMQKAKAMEFKDRVFSLEKRLADYFEKYQAERSLVPRPEVQVFVVGPHDEIMDLPGMEPVTHQTVVAGFWNEFNQLKDFLGEEKNVIEILRDKIKAIFVSNQLRAPQVFEIIFRDGSLSDHLPPDLKVELQRLWERRFAPGPNFNFEQALNHFDEDVSAKILKNYAKSKEVVFNLLGRIAEVRSYINPSESKVVNRIASFAQSQGIGYLADSLDRAQIGKNASGNRYPVTVVDYPMATTDDLKSSATKGAVRGVVGMVAATTLLSTTKGWSLADPPPVSNNALKTLLENLAEDYKELLVSKKN